MVEPTHNRVDVIVVSWNSGPDLGPCLDALPRWARAIVVDNGSSDDSVAIAEASGAEVLSLGRNLGFPAAVNRGLALVQAPATLLLNPDVVVEPGAVERCLQVLEAEPEVGIVGADTVEPGGRPEPSAARRDRTAWHIVVESFGLTELSDRFDRQTIRGRSADRDVDAVNGAFMLLRTQQLRELGGLDEAVFMYLEDADLCRRVRHRGLAVRFVAGARTVHGGGTSTARGDSGSQVRAYLHRIDADVEFLRRWGRPWEPPVAALAYALRAVIGLVISLLQPDRRARYRAALPFALAQLRRRTPAPPV
jgi:N-acetylglucosaminyl-diphospho-decaprenol L-rhamnosyltransferase